jgi:hypothetical protein
MKQTAVEWYAEKSGELELKRTQGDISLHELVIELSNLLQQAKEMEKEQMIEFAKYTSVIDTEKSDMNKVVDFYLTLDGEEFIEETFKSE